MDSDFVRILGGYIEIKTDRDYWYDITMQSLSSVKGLEDWLCHLNEKKWFNQDRQNALVKLCENKFGYIFNGKYRYNE